MKGTKPMTMSIKQSDLYRFERMVSKLVKPSDTPTICFVPVEGGLKLCAFSKDAMLTMLVNKTGFLDPIMMQWNDIKSIAIKKDVDITFDLKKDSVHIRYGEEQCWCSVNKKVNSLPHQSSETSTHDKMRMLNALNEAGRCIDKDSIRTALNGICLRGGSSQIISTSGIQLLVQEGYDFTWGESDVVCPVSKLFGSKELREIEGDNVAVGLVAEFVHFSIGVVDIWLRAIDGKFPKVAGIIKPAAEMTYLCIHPTDVRFILERIDKLLGSKEHESPVYLALDDKIQVRSHDSIQKACIALELTHSTFTGKNVSVSMNRLFLKNALQLDCLRIGIDPKGATPVICDNDDDKTFVFMPLRNAEPEADHVEVIPSTTQPIATTKAAIDVPPPVKCRRKVAVKRSHSKQPESKVAVLQSAEDIRQTLRQSLVLMNTLIREVKAQRKQDRLLRTTMDSLNKLKLTVA
jgi:hypothetical protein